MQTLPAQIKNVVTSTLIQAIRELPPDKLSVRPTAHRPTGLQAIRAMSRKPSPVVVNQDKMSENQPPCPIATASLPPVAPACPRRALARAPSRDSGQADKAAMGTPERAWCFSSARSEVVASEVVLGAIDGQRADEADAVQP